MPPYFRQHLVLLCDFSSMRQDIYTMISILIIRLNPRTSLLSSRSITLSAENSGKIDFLLPIFATV